MQAQFNRPIILGRASYAKGTHDVPDTDAKGWFWDALVADGGIVVNEPKPIPVSEPQAEEKPKRRRGCK